MNAFAGGGRRIHIQEVGLRDGLQAECRFVPTADKIALADLLSGAGLAKLEVSSFVSPKAVPVLADAGDVFAGIARAPGVVYSALVPNVRGAERAVAAGVGEMNLVMSASESHNLSNLRMRRAQSFAGLADVAALARCHGIAVNVSLSCSFGCPVEGDVPQHEVLDWCARFVDELGVHGITLCDTTGMAFAPQVAALVAAFRARFAGTELTLHFHDTRHEATSRFFEAGLKIEQVALITGHKDWKMLRRYTHIKAKSVHAAVAQLPTWTDPDD